MHEILIEIRDCQGAGDKIYSAHWYGSYYNQAFKFTFIGSSSLVVIKKIFIYWKIYRIINVLILNTNLYFKIYNRYLNKKFKKLENKIIINVLN